MLAPKCHSAVCLGIGIFFHCVIFAFLFKNFSRFVSTLIFMVTHTKSDTLTAFIVISHYTRISGC